MRPGLTHQSVGLTLANDSHVEETWDLSDSLADLFKEVNRRDRDASSQSRPGVGGEGGGGGAKTQPHPRVAEDAWKHVDVSRWIGDDTSHGFIRVSSSENVDNSRLFPCTLSTTAQKICVQLGIPHNALHVQLNGDIIRRMEPFDCPLAVQNEYLASIGYTDVRRIQEEGAKEELSFLVKFYSGQSAPSAKMKMMTMMTMVMMTMVMMMMTMVMMMMTMMIPPKMAGGCPCGGILKERSHTHPPHPN